jgi:hypothetical protein
VATSRETRAYSAGGRLRDAPGAYSGSSDKCKSSTKRKKLVIDLFLIFYNHIRSAIALFIRQQMASPMANIDQNGIENVTLFLARACGACPQPVPK